MRYKPAILISLHKISKKKNTAKPSTFAHARLSVRINKPTQQMSASPEAEMTDKQSAFSPSDRIRSIRDAARGIATMVASQHNAWIHAAATAVILLLGLYFGFSKAEWCWIVLAIVTVWTAEALNTAFELLADISSPGFHPLVKKAKDVAAGAVLIAAIGSAAIGLFIIGPYLAALFRD